MSRLVAIDARLVGGNSTGDSTYWTSLLDAMSRLDDDTRFILYSNAPAPSRIALGDRFAWKTISSRSSRWWSYVQFPLAARRAGADVVHVQYALSPLIGRRGVTTIHDVSFFVGPEWFLPRDRFLLQKSVPAAAKRAAQIITVSETSGREVEEYIPAAKGKVKVTPLACPNWIQPVERSEALARVESALGVSGPYVLTVGTRWPRKNMGLAVETVSALPSELPHRLLVTGKAGWGNNELGPRGIATGYVDADLLSSLYSGADAYLAPSHHEGFGLPVLEAFRCSCPVLCSSGGAFPEVADNAAVVERTWEASSWSDSLRRMLIDPGTLQTLRERGNAREKTFTWEETARRTLAVYREVAS